MNYIITIDYTDYFLQGDKDLGTICRSLSKLQKIERDYESADKEEKILKPVKVELKQTTLSVVKSRKKTDYIDPEILPRRGKVEEDMFGPLHMLPGPTKSMDGKTANGLPGRRAIGRVS